MVSSVSSSSIDGAHVHDRGVSPEIMPICVDRGTTSSRRLVCSSDGATAYGRRRLPQTRESRRAPILGGSNSSCQRRALRRLFPVTYAGFTFSFFYRIPPIAGNEISAEISPNFANSEQKENSNSKTEFR